MNRDHISIKQKRTCYFEDLLFPPEYRSSFWHSTATELEFLGVSPSVIAQVLRHKSYATTAKHYINISNDQALDAVNLISRK